MYLLLEILINLSYKISPINQKIYFNAYIVHMKIYEKCYSSYKKLIINPKIRRLF